MTQVQTAYEVEVGLKDKVTLGFETAGRAVLHAAGSGLRHSRTTPRTTLKPQSDFRPELHRAGGLLSNQIE